jgi:hypothetical protein
LNKVNTNKIAPSDYNYRFGSGDPHTKTPEGMGILRSKKEKWEK